MAVPLVDCPSTQVIGNNDQSLQLSGRLAKKLSKQVLVSFNLEDDILQTHAGDQGQARQILKS